MSEKSKTSSGGISFLGLLTILFIGLKLTGHISWEWKWVLAPIWIPITIALIILAVTVVIFGILELFEVVKEEK